MSNVEVFAQHTSALGDQSAIISSDEAKTGIATCRWRWLSSLNHEIAPAHAIYGIKTNNILFRNKSDAIAVLR